MDLKLLADHPEMIPTIAGWYQGEWGGYVENSSVQKFEDSLKTLLNRDCIPLIVTAAEGEELLGVAQLK